MPTPDLRCGDCRDLQLECPRGYFGGACSCDTCGYKFSLSAARCAPRIHCPECRGTVTYEGEEEPGTQP